MKKTKTAKIAFILAGVLTISACEPGSKQGFGTMLGAIGGAAIGSALGDNGSGTTQFFAVAAGTLAGAAIGSSIGRSLDKADHLAMERNRQVALETYPSGQTATWYNIRIRPGPIAGNINRQSLLAAKQKTLTVKLAVSLMVHGRLYRNVIHSFKRFRFDIEHFPPHICA